MTNKYMGYIYLYFSSKVFNYHSLSPFYLCIGIDFGVTVSTNSGLTLALLSGITFHITEKTLEMGLEMELGPVFARQAPYPLYHFHFVDE